MRDNFWWVIAFLTVFIAVSAFFQIKGATECAAKGGAYLVSQNSWPVCVAGVK